MLSFRQLQRCLQSYSFQRLQVNLARSEWFGEQPPFVECPHDAIYFSLDFYGVISLITIRTNESGNILDLMGAKVSLFEMILSCGKPIISANSCFFQDDELELNADLFAMMRIWDHNKDTILHRVKVLFAWIRACKSKACQSFDQFPT